MMNAFFQNLASVPDKIWLLVLLGILLAAFAFSPESAQLQKWIEYTLIALIAVLRGGAAPQAVFLGFSK